MSFILDALRKSENERRMDSMPMVSRAPMSVPQRGLPIWAVVIIASLTAALIAVLATSWYQDDRAAAPELVSGQSVTITAPVTTEVSADNNPTDEMASSAGEQLTRGDSGALVGAGILPSRDESPNDTNSAVDDTTALEPGLSAAVALPREIPKLDVASLPSLSELRADGLAVASLDLQLHVASSNPTNRFVMINGKRYGENDRLAEGGTIVAIADAGVVIRVSGREFLLSTD